MECVEYENGGNKQTHTEDGEDDNDEIEYVPGTSEVVPSKSHQFENGLQGEECCENNVQNLGHIGNLFGRKINKNIKLHAYTRHIL